MSKVISAKGVPFRKAHGIVGKLVAAAEKDGKKLADLTQTELRKACKLIGEDVADYLGTANVVKRYAPEGTGGPKQLKKQLAFWRKKLA